MAAVDEPVQLPRIRRQLLGDQLQARLEAMPGVPAVTVFRGEAGDPPVKTDADGVEDPSGRVAPYVVVFDGAGATDLEPSLGSSVGDDERRGDEQLRWTPQVTVAAGFSEDCVDALDRVYAWLRPWSPALAGVAAGRLQPPPGFDPGPPRPDRTVAPIRYFVPLQWQLDLTT